MEKPRPYASCEPCATSEPPTEPSEEANPQAVPRGPLAVAGLAISVVVVGLTLWTFKEHVGAAIVWLAELAENAGPWGVVATVLALTMWVMVPLMPINLFEVLVGPIFPLWTALAARSQGPPPAATQAATQL